MKVWAVQIAIACMLTAITIACPLSPVAAQESHSPSPVVGAGWCAVKMGDEETPGCDIGAGVALVHVNRISWIAVVGTKTVGMGLAWTVSNKPVVAVAVGVICEYDETGIDGSKVYPALGATLSFNRGAQP